MSNRRTGISGIEANGFHIQIEAFALPVQPRHVGDTVMDVPGGDMSVSDDPEPAIDRSVIEIEEALWLAIAHHIASIRIGATDLGILHIRLAIDGRQWFLAEGGAIRINGSVQRIPIIRPASGYQFHIEATLVGRSLQMGAVRIENVPIHQPEANGLFHDMVKDLLRDLGAVKPPPPVLAEGAGVKHPVR